MEGYSIDAQKEFLVSYCKMHEIEEYEFYTDGGYTGSNINRPDLNRLIDDVEEGIINLVVVFKLDRLSRSQKDTLFLIEEEFPFSIIPSSIKCLMDFFTFFAVIKSS